MVSLFVLQENTQCLISVEHRGNILTQYIITDYQYLGLAWDESHTSGVLVAISQLDNNLTTSIMQISQAKQCSYLARMASKGPC